MDVFHVSRCPFSHPFQLCTDPSHNCARTRTSFSSGLGGRRVRTSRPSSFRVWLGVCCVRGRRACHDASWTVWMRVYLHPPRCGCSCAQTRQGVGASGTCNGPCLASSYGCVFVPGGVYLRARCRKRGVSGMQDGIRGVDEGPRTSDWWVCSSAMSMPSCGGRFRWERNVRRTVVPWVTLDRDVLVSLEKHGVTKARELVGSREKS